MNNVTLFLVDESVDLEIIKIKVAEYKNSKIISFDFNTHKLLLENGIAHDKIEDFFDNSDYQKIDDAVVSLSVNWYKKKNLEPYLEYRNINLGSLLELEMPSFLFPIVKKFYGVLRLVEKDKPSMIVAPLAVSNIVKTISDEVPVHTFEKMKKDDQPLLVFDYIQLKFNIGGIPFRFSIRRSTFFRIKKFLENFTRLFLNLKPDFKRSMPDAILMLDFNPIVYKDLFVELSKLNKQILLLNQRRPAIQNLQSINIIKKAKCKILRLDDFLDSDLKKKIDDNTSAKLDQLYEMWNNDNMLNPIFSVEGYSLWNVVKDSFTQTCNNRFTECIYGLELAAKMFEKIKFKCILEWAHTATDEKIICLEANKLHIPIIFLQHGLMVLNQLFQKFRAFMPFFPSNGAKMAVWGDIMKEFNINNGIKEDLVLNTGSPRHDVYFSRRQIKGKPKGVILLAATSFVEINANGNDTDALMNFEKIIETICREAGKISNKKLIVKLHPGQLFYDIKPVVHSIDPSIPIYQGKNFLELLEVSDVMISLSLSTTMLEAMIMDVPTITIIAEDQGFEDEIIIKSKATLTVKTPEEFKKALHDVLYDEKIRNELIRKGREYVDRYMSHQGTASKHLSEILSKY